MSKYSMIRRLLPFMVLLFAVHSYGQIPAGEQMKKEYLLVKAEYRIKGDNVVCKLFVGFGEHFPNSMKGVLENGENGTVKLLLPGGKVTVITEDVDILNYLANQGWTLQSALPVKVGDRDETQYIFYKKSK
ncbi:MAG: hypothetical protein KDD36_03335 [Flavobacteriales bacterium]|nr:hypothetical protein [Flavobacteriales bacterium]